MKKILFILFAIFHAISGWCISPRSYHSFQHITGENGLSQNNVKAIYKDSFGFIWFGTKNGLNRFDGQNIKEVECYDPVSGIGNQNISALSEDQQGNLWVGTDKGVFRYDISHERFTHVNLHSQDGKTMENWVAQIKCDHTGAVWISIPNQGVFRYDKDKLTHYELLNEEDKHSEAPAGLAISSDNRIWTGTWHKGLFRFDERTNRFVHVSHDRDGTPLTGLPINDLCPHADGIVLSLQDGRLMKYNPEADKLTEIPFGNEKHSIVRTAMSVDRCIWAGTYDGIFIIDESAHAVRHLRHDASDRFSLSDNIIYSMYKDKDGDIWIGTMFGGVSHCSGNGIRFRNMSNGLTSERLRGLAMDKQGTLYVGTEDAGINIISPSGTVKTAGNPHLTVFSMTMYGNDVYCGLFNEGLLAVDTQGNTRRFPAEELRTEDISVFSFLIDKAGNKWIGTGAGLYTAPPETFHSHKVEETKRAWIHDIFQDKDGNIWFASMGSGVWKRNAEDGTFKHYETGQKNGLSSNSVSSVMQDSQGNIWLSTDGGGICRYNPRADKFDAYSIQQGLPDNVAYSILEDRQGNLWFGTNKGLVRFNPERNDIHTFTTHNGLPGNQFNYKSAVKAPDGTLYFGSINGLVAFNPSDTAIVSPAPKPLYITKFSIYGEDITPNTSNTPLKESIITTERVVLNHDQSNFSFDMAMLNYSEAEGIRYFYRLDPLDKQWIKASDNKNISYAKLPPGNYTLYIKAIDSHGLKVEKTLDITVRPPWFLSVWAFIAYIILLITIAFAWFRWYRSHKEAQLAERQRFFEMQKEKELYMAKMELFTEVAHEIRTPLTLINGPLETIKEMDLHDDRLKDNIHVMDKNTKRLLDLASQLLDFQKLESRKVTLKHEETDVADLLRETCERFAPTISRSGKHLETDIPYAVEPAYIDKEAITKIISNLLSNALKYARRDIQVSLAQEGSNFVIKVKSDGDKIPDSCKEQIFDPFYRMETNRNMAQGTGIGLPLARSLATLHKGRLYLEDQEDACNTFVLSVPLREQGKGPHLQKSGNIPEKTDNGFIHDETGTERLNTHDYTILLVEDNEDMTKFLSEKIKELFGLRTAANGKEALDILKAERIDLIVSDVMMPVMNGYELCRSVKSDMEISHIPIIFLTAKNDLDSKIKGLRQGAEAFVEKPFSFKFLKAQIVTLLSNRQKEREAFAKHPFLPNKEKDSSPADKEFMDKVLQVFNENITDENLNIERIADILCMSRSGLYRKIKTLTGISPVEFLRVIRLKKAAELILTGKYRINEICFMVGINAPSYFSKIFQKQFGMTPKEFERLHLKKEEGVSKF